MRFERLGNIVEIIGGNAAPKGDNAFGSSGLPFIKMKDLGSKHLTNNLVEIENLVSDSVAKVNRLKVIKKGAILLPRSGSVGLNHRAVLGVDAYMVSHICALKVKNEREVFNQYLYYYLTTINFNSITKKTTGLDAITFQDLAKVVVPLPSLSDQFFFANILSQAETLIARRKESIWLLDEFLKSTFLEMFGDPVKNEKGLSKITLGKLGNWRSGGTPSRSNKEFFNGNIPWLN
jgi:type I restriction enzyme, S subunit